MTTNNDTRSATMDQQHDLPVRVIDTMDAAARLLAGVELSGQLHLTSPAGEDWRAGEQLYDDDNRRVHLMGLILQLHALLREPEVMTKAVQAFCDKLDEAADQLGLVRDARVQTILRGERLRAEVRGSQIDSPPATSRNVDQMDATNWASGIVDAAINMGIRNLFPPAARLLWDAGAPLLESERGSLQARMGYVLMLDALAASPEVLARVVRDVRDTLVCCDPDLEIMQRPAG